jgi:hypothetical protein
LDGKFHAFRGWRAAVFGNSLAVAGKTPAVADGTLASAGKPSAFVGKIAAVADGFPAFAGEFSAFAGKSHAAARKTIVCATTYKIALTKAEMRSPSRSSAGQSCRFAQTSSTHARRRNSSEANTTTNHPRPPSTYGTCILQLSNAIPDFGAKD